MISTVETTESVSILLKVIMTCMTRRRKKTWKTIKTTLTRCKTIAMKKKKSQVKKKTKTKIFLGWVEDPNKRRKRRSGTSISLTIVLM